MFNQESGDTFEFFEKALSNRGSSVFVVKNPRRQQRLAPLQGAVNKSSRQFCSQPGDGFLLWTFHDLTGFQFGFPSIRFSLPRFLDLGV